MKKIFFDFLPVFVFFITYKFTNIFIATIALIIATLLQVLYELVVYRKISTISLITFIAILIFGGATVYFGDEKLIKLKVTIINWLFSIILIYSSYFMKSTIIERIIGHNIELPKKVWKKLNNIWGWFFFFLGILNLIVMYSFSTNFWVNFKLFGILGITIVFIIFQSIFLSKYLNKERK